MITRRVCTVPHGIVARVFSQVLYIRHDKAMYVRVRYCVKTKMEKDLQKGGRGPVVVKQKTRCEEKHIENSHQVVW